MAGDERDRGPCNPRGSPLHTPLEFPNPLRRPKRLDDRGREPEQALRRAGRGARRLVHGARGADPGLPRPQRRRQDHHHAHHHRLPAGDQRHGPGRGLRRFHAVERGPPPHRLPAREPAPLQRHDGGRLPALRRQAEGHGARRHRRSARPGARDLRVDGRARPAARPPLQGLPAACRPRPGAHPRPAGADPRRADHRPRPAADHRDPEPHQDARRQAHRRPLDPHPARGVAGLRQGGHHQRRAHRGRGPAREPDARAGARGRLHRGHLARHGRRRTRGRRHGDVSVRNVLTIGGRELRSYFSSPVAYVLLAAYLALAGYFFFALLSAFNQTLQMYSMMRSNPEMLSRFNLNQMVVVPLLHNMSVLLIFIVPAISMRMFPEEQRSGTYELLLTSPVRVGEIVLGKFLGGLGLVLLMVALSGYFGRLLVRYGNPEVPMMVAGYLGLALMATVFLAIGTLISSFTDNVVIAYVGALFALLVLYTIGWLGETMQGAAGGIVRYASITEHFSEMTKGIIDTKDVVYFATLLLIALFLTLRSVESVRWR